MRKIYTLSLFSLLSLTSAFAGPWTQRATMGGLGRHRAFSMSIGNHGYVGGGWNGNTMYYDFWDFDPATNSWTQKANIPTYLWSDPAFGIGTKGYVMDNGYTYMYLPYNNTWTTVNTSSPSATYYDQLKFVINGKGYLSDGATIYEFNPSGYTWIPKYNFSSAFYGDLAFAVNGKGYFVDTYYNTVMEYNPVSNSIQYKSSCPGVMSQGTSWAVNGKGYCGLGQIPPNYTDEQQVYEYDPVLDNWKGVNDFEGAGRENATAFVIGTKGYVTCGTSGINMNDLWEFDNTKITSVMDVSNSSLISVFPNPSVDGKFYVEQGASVEVKIVSVKVMSLDGKLVKEEQLNSNCIDLSEFPDANYNLVFFDENKRLIAAKKVVMVK
jgi:hypothetical protein